MSVAEAAQHDDLQAADVTADLELVSREIDRSVDEIAGFLNSQHGRLVDHVTTLLADSRLWQGDGLWTMQAWLAWRAGMSATTAGHLVAIAERADELPVCIERFRRGELSLDQMAAVAKRAPSWTDAQTAGLAPNMTVRQIRRLLATYPFPTDELDEREVGEESEGSDPDPSSSAEAGNDARDAASDTDEPDGADGESDSALEGVAGGGNDRAGDTTTGAAVDEWCSWWWDDDGTLRFSGRADADAGAIIVAALTEARDRLYRSRDGEVSWLDALREIAERSLDTVTEPARRQRFRISAFIDTDDKMSIAGRPVTPSVQRHLTCDGQLVPIMLDNGLPLSVGRSQRIVPDRTRRIVEERDGNRCRVPGCGTSHFLEVHHIIHWLSGGPTDTWNLISLCPHHHRLHHQDRLGIAGSADIDNGVTFTDAKGRMITPSGAKPIPPSGPPPPPAGRYLHPTGERFDTRWFEFRRPPDHARRIA